MSIISAHEAAQIARQSDPIDAKINSIMKAIHKRSNQAQFNLVLSEELTEPICKRLQFLGYDIIITFHKSGAQYWCDTCLDWSNTWEGKEGTLKTQYEEKPREMTYF